MGRPDHVCPQPTSPFIRKKVWSISFKQTTTLRRNNNPMKKFGILALMSVASQIDPPRRTPIPNTPIKFLLLSLVMKLVTSHNNRHAVITPLVDSRLRLCLVIARIASFVVRPSEGVPATHASTKISALRLSLSVMIVNMAYLRPPPLRNKP